MVSKVFNLDVSLAKNYNRCLSCKEKLKSSFKAQQDEKEAE